MQVQLSADASPVVASMAGVKFDSLRVLTHFDGHFLADSVLQFSQ